MKLASCRTVGIRVALVVAIICAGLASLVQSSNVRAAELLVGPGDVAGLVSAITTANANGEADTIVLSPDSIYELETASYFDESTGSTGLPPITSDITIVGNGATITRNTSTGFRILYVGSSGKLTLDGVTISNGYAIGFGRSGGNIYVSSGELTLTNSTVTNGNASLGGGIRGNDNSQITLINSTVSGNEGVSSGGGINTSGTLTLINATISNNSTNNTGGGLYVSLDGNTKLTNTIVAGNHATLLSKDIYGAVTGSHNLIGNGHDMTGLTDGIDGNHVGTRDNPIDPLLGSLEANNGPTPTMALLTGSPAIDAGTTIEGVTPDTDQRGISRGHGPAVDIGAFELAYDTIPPNVTADVTGTKGDNEWYVTDVSVSWNVTDDSPYTTVGCDNQTITEDTTGTTLTCAATDVAGTTDETVVIKRDTTPPVIQFTGNLPRYSLTDDIAITCTASDATSGIASVEHCDTISGSATSFGRGTHTFTATATDNAGNEGTATIAFVVGASYADLCTLTQQVYSKRLLANAACLSLGFAQIADRAGNQMVEEIALNTYRVQVRLAMAIRQLTAEDGQTLLDWSYSLD